MKRTQTPLSKTTVFALLTAFSGNVYSQSPLVSQLAESPPRPYTVPADPQADRVSASDGNAQHDGAYAGGLFEPVNIEPEPVSVEPVFVERDGVEPVSVEDVSVEPYFPETYNPNALGPEHFLPQPSRVEPVSVEPVSVEPVSVEPAPVGPFGVETVSAEFDVECDCWRSNRYRPRCSQCRNQAGLISNQNGQWFLGGWIQQGFTGNFGSPSNRINGPLLFNDRSNDYRLNQLYFFAERDVQPNGRDWDLGGRVDVLFGSDARFLTVPGLERHKDRTRKWNSETHDYGIALPQAYAEIAAPWFNGTSIKAGHFYANAGYESAPAPENFFYSHSYTFTYGEPFTFTGALAETRANDHLTLRAGYTNGWDVFDSSSREFGILAGFAINSADKRSSLAVTVHSGSDVTNSRVGGVLFDADRHFLSLVFQHALGERWRYVFQHDFGYQEDAEIVVNTAGGTISNDTAKWYSINQYLIHDINEQLSSGLRVEWFRDQDHSRIGIPVSFRPGGPTFEGGNYVGITGGFNWRPHPNVAIRPELRWDYADLKGNGNAPGGNPGFRAFDDNTSSSQGTAALDVILLF